MDAARQSILNHTNGLFEIFAQFIETEFKISKTDVMNRWNGKKAVVPSPAILTVPSPAKKPESVSTTCPYKFIRGDKKGEPCGVKVAVGATHCAKHKTDSTSTSSTSTTSSTSSSIATSSTSSSIATSSPAVLPKSLPVIAKKQFSVVKNKFGNYEHLETHFVVDRATKEIYGRQTETELVDLSAEDIEECKQRQLKYREPKKFESAEDVEVEEEIIEEEEEEEEIEEEEEVEEEN